MTCEGVVATPKIGTSNVASSLSTSCAVVKRAVYGVGTNLRNPVAYADDESLAHVAGRTVVVYDATKRRQSFLHVPNQVKRIRAMAVHAGSKNIAIAVSNGEDASAVLVYDAESLKKKKTLRRAERKQTPVTTASVTTGSLNLTKPSTDDEMDIDGLAFSADGSSILGYGSSAETLACWNVADGSVAELASQRPNIVAGGSSRRDGNTTESRIVEAQFSSRDEDVVSAICTSGVFKLYRAQGKILKPFVVKALNELQKDVGRRAVAHVWLDDDDGHVAIGTDANSVIILNGETIVCTVRVGARLPGAMAMKAFGGGFIVAGNGGEIIFVEKVARRDGSNAYEVSKRLNLMRNGEDTATMRLLSDSSASLADQSASEPSDDSIVAMDVSPSKENLLCCLRSGSVFSVSLSHIQILQADEMEFRRVLSDSHQDGVAGLDVCPSRQIMVTVGSNERVIKVWNLKTNACEISEVFLDSPLSVSVHPSGWIIAVGFYDKLRIIHVLRDELRVVKEFNLKTCRLVRFARGGHMFCAASGSVIHVKHTFTHETIAVLHGHCGKIKSLTWGAGDATLLTTAVDGAVYDWDIITASQSDERPRRREHVRKGCVYTSTTHIPHTGGIVACSNTSKLIELDHEFNAAREFSSEDVTLTHVRYNTRFRAVFATTSIGSLRIYKFPLTGEYSEVHCHVGPISALALNQDETRAYTAGKDACVVIHELRVEGADAQHSFEESNASDDEILVKREEFDEMQERMRELQTELKDLSLQNQYQLRLQAAEMGDRLKSSQATHASMLERERNRVAELERENVRISNDAVVERERLSEEASGELARVVEEYDGKLFAEIERSERLVNKAKEVEREMHEERDKIRLEHLEQVENIKREFANERGELREEISKLERRLEAAYEEFARAREIMDEEVENEITQIKSEYESQIHHEHEAALRLRGENGVFKTKLATVKVNEHALHEDISKLADEKRAMSEEIARLERKLDESQMKMTNLESEIEIKGKLIVTKERDVARELKKVSELTSDISRLEQQRDDASAKLDSTKNKMDEMNGEMLNYYEANCALVRQAQEMRAQRDALQKESARNRKQADNMMDVVKRFQRDLHSCAKNIQDVKSLKENIKNLYHKYTGEDVFQPAENNDAVQEMKRQRDHYEKTIASLKRQMEGDASARRSEFHRVMRENQSLLEQLRTVEAAAR